MRNNNPKTIIAKFPTASIIARTTNDRELFYATLFVSCSYKAAARGEQGRKGSRRDIGLAGFFPQVLLATVEMIKGGSGTQLDHFP